MKKLLIILTGLLLFLSVTGQVSFAASNTFRCGLDNGNITGHCVTTVNDCNTGNVAKFNNLTTCEDVDSLTCLGYQNNSSSGFTCISDSQTSPVNPNVCRIGARYCEPGTQKLAICNSTGTGSQQVLADCALTGSTCEESNGTATCVKHTCNASQLYCVDGTHLALCKSDGSGPVEPSTNCAAADATCQPNADSSSASCVANTHSVCEPNKQYCADRTHLALCNDTGTGPKVTTECGVGGIMGHAQVCDPVKLQCVLAPTTPSTAPNQGTPGGGGGNNGAGSGNGAGTVLSLDKLLGTLAGMQRPGSLFTFGPDTKLGTIVGAILPLFYTLAGIVLLVFMIMAGFKYLTSAGDAKKTEQAKGALTAAIMGFVIIIVAYFVTQIVNTIFQLGAGI